MQNELSTSADEYNYLRTEELLPSFTWNDETGKSFSSESLKGKPSLIILFTKDCRHCTDNFVYLEKKLFSKNINSLRIIAFGRDCNHQQVESYRMNYNLSIKLIADPERNIYSKFAEKVVPRIYFFDSESRLKLSVRGFRTYELDEIILRCLMNK